MLRLRPQWLSQELVFPASACTVGEVTVLMAVASKRCGGARRSQISRKFWRSCCANLSDSPSIFY